MSAALQAAQAYVARGWNPSPLPFKAKKPTDNGWQKRIIRAPDLARHFNGALQNVGIVLGPSSDGLTDTDLDCSEAIALAPHVLPRTGAIFGRNSAPASHWLYRTNLASTSEDQNATIQFKDPTRPAGEVMLLEVRVGGEKGAQTVFPGSVHESDEEIRWDENGEPAQVDNDDLLKRARLLAAICLLTRYWPGSGARHDAAQSLGGFLARIGLPAPKIKYLVEAIARTAGDAEHQDRKNTAEDAAHIGQCWSLDAWLARSWRKGSGTQTASDPYAAPGWGLRLLQIQMALIFISTALVKVQGELWVHGTALYYVSRLSDMFGRLPVPAWLFETPWTVALMTWSVIAVELVVPIFIWFRETRRLCLVGLLLFHLANEWTMNLFFFHWIMLVGWISFLTPDDFRWLRFCHQGHDP